MKRSDKPTAVVESPWMTKVEAAKYRRCSVRTLDRAKDIPRHKVDGIVLYHRDELDAAILAK